MLNQAIFVDDATRAVMPPDPEMIQVGHAILCRSKVGFRLTWAFSGFRLCVPKTSSTSCDQAIFVDQATDVSLSSDAVLVEIDRLG